jgi:hypothetical protein
MRYMNQRENLYQPDNTLTLSPGDRLTLSVSDESLFRFTETPGATVMEINNYLKTPEEIEAEFCFVINTRKDPYCETDDSFDTYGRIRKKTDGYINMPNLEALSGFMEENY